MSGFDILIQAMYSKLKEHILISTNKSNKDEMHRYQSNEMLISLRTDLEPFIYQYLSQKYGPALEEFWETYIPPKKSTIAFVILEPRIHPNFKFILQNIAWANPGASIYIFCSDLNYFFIESILGDKLDSFHVVQYIQDIKSKEEGYSFYNSTLIEKDIYTKIDAEYMITVQMDTFFRRQFTNELCVGSYWGSPWMWAKENPGGGGVTVRNIKVMRKILPKTFPGEIPQDMREDGWIGNEILRLGLEYPPFPFRRDMLMENIAADNPIAVHQFWTFLSNFNPLEQDEFIQYIHSLLTLQNLKASMF